MANDEKSVRVFEGIDGIKQIYLDTLSLPPESTIYAFLSPDSVHPDIYSWLTTEYVIKRKEKKLFAHVFVTSDIPSTNIAAYTAKDADEYRQTHIIPTEKTAFSCEIDIYGDKVAMINYNPNGKIMGVIIDHPMIAQTIKSLYLHYYWKL